MSRYLLPASLFCVAAAILFWAVPRAEAGADDPVKCYPADQVLTAQGTDSTRIAASAQVLIKRQLGEGRKNMIELESGGAKFLCFWK